MRNKDKHKRQGTQRQQFKAKKDAEEETIKLNERDTTKDGMPNRITTATTKKKKKEKFESCMEEE